MDHADLSQEQLAVVFAMTSRRPEAFDATEHEQVDTDAELVTCQNGGIEVALRAIGLERDDEVIVTPRTFIASASAIVMCGGVPVFVDVDSNTQNIDPRHVAAAVSPRTRAIRPAPWRSTLAGQRTSVAVPAWGRNPPKESSA